MAIIKLKFTKNKRKIKAHVRYITHRPNREGGRSTRKIFDNRGGEIEKTDAYKIIDQTPRSARFYKPIISPDPKTEDVGLRLDMWQIARGTILALEERLQKRLVFFGVLHNDHSDNRHVHLIFTHSGKLNRADIKALRQAATIASGGQQRARERIAEKAVSGHLRIQVFRESAPVRPRRAARPVRLVILSTRFCGTCLTFTPQLTLPGNRQFCQSCRRVLGPTLGLAHSKEAEWGR